MARIKRWKEKVLIAWFTLFASVVWARPRSRTPEEGHSGAARSVLVTRSGGKRAWGVTLSAARPYVRAFSASAVPVALPVAVGAFAASPAATAGLAGDAANAAGTYCPICITSLAPPCSLTAASCCDPFPACTYTSDGICRTGTGGCYTMFCSLAGFSPCYTCGFGTCPC